jgi:hypothetical protein
MWEWMGKYEEKTGGRVLAIPHNGNLSNGRMFEPVDFAGKPLTRDYAERRARWEVLQEVMQTKGNSETHPTLSPNDEFADFGIAGWEYGNLTMEGKPETPEMRPFMYLRGGLMQGLAHEQKLGINPFKFGMIGGIDVHNFFGKHVNQEPRPERWKHVSKQGFGKTRYTWQYTAAGYAAVWAKENTREALWDAMKRKEAYATSGTRMTVRFFGGWNFKPEDILSRQPAEIGYAKGVPMGADLPPATEGVKAPTFLVGALLTPVGDTVNVAEATWTNTIGDPDLQGVWKDPDFNPAEPAFYYVRVIEIPTPRWTAYDQKRFGIKMSDDVPMKHQERAWTSPIWYSPKEVNQ